MKKKEQTLPFFLKEKLGSVSASIFSVMTAMANEAQAINMAQGFPDFSCDKELQDLVYQYIQKGCNQYAPMPGVYELRTALAGKIKELYGQTFDPETEITITAGATQAIFTAIQSFVHPDDEVIVFTPAYDSYVPAIDLAGGKPVYYQMVGPDFKIDWAKVKNLINSQTRMMIINTPHNPSGKVFTKEDLTELERILKNTNIILISDEVYEHIVFDGKRHVSVCELPYLKERSLVISSFGKVYHTTGWKIGYCYGPDYLMKEFRKVHQYNVFSVNTPIQYAYAAYLQYKEKYLSLSSFYQRKRDYFLDLIKDSAFTFKPAEGTYFQLLNYQQLSEDNDVAFAEKLTRQFKIASIPVSVFYHKKVQQHYLRFCFAKNDETLMKAAEILNNIKL